MIDLFHFSAKRLNCSVFAMWGLAVGLLVDRNGMLGRWDISIWLGPLVLMASARAGEADRGE